MDSSYSKYEKPITSKQSYRFLLILLLIAMVYTLSTGNLLAFGIITIIPITIITLILVLQSPSFMFYLILILNHFFIAIIRYTDVSGLSVLMDILLFSELALIFVYGALTQKIEWSYALNTITGVTFAWMVYCIFEVVNPTGLFEAWYLSRSLIYNGFIVSLIASLVVQNYKQVKGIILLYAILTILAVLKALMQKIVGFDFAEQRWLDAGSSTTHIIATGIRYFSFFSDAGNFGSNMGCASIIFGILTYTIESRKLKIFYAIVAALALYAMFMSGTRGAMIVPLAGLALFTMLSGNIKALAIGGALLAIIYFFFAFTYIGESNQMIRRMRTSFRPSKDASFNVRLDNQARLREYLKNKPFGEGLGLAGTENNKLSDRFTTQIPHDSWYVKIWVETGIIGLTLYVAGMIAILIHCCYVIMKKVKSKELRGVLTALLCGIFGMMLSAYGNAFWGQFPTTILAYTFLSIVLKGEYFDKELINA